MSIVISSGFQSCQGFRTVPTQNEPITGLPLIAMHLGVPHTSDGLDVRVPLCLVLINVASPTCR